MEYQLTLPVTVGKNNIGLLTMEVGYETSDDVLIETLIGWKTNIVPATRQKGLYVLKGGRRMVNEMFLDVLFPLSLPTRNRLLEITDPVALHPDEGFSALMLDEICSCLYNGAQLLIDNVFVPFASYYRLNFPMFKLGKVLSFQRTELEFERITNAQQNRGL